MVLSEATKAKRLATFLKNKEEGKHKVRASRKGTKLTDAEKLKRAQTVIRRMEEGKVYKMRKGVKLSEKEKAQRKLTRDVNKAFKEMKIEER
jgi:hypothetical protein